MIIFNLAKEYHGIISQGVEVSWQVRFYIASKYLSSKYLLMTKEMVGVTPQWTNLADAISVKWSTWPPVMGQMEIETW